jgi:phosphoglucomutase
MTVHKLAGKPAPRSLLVNIPRLMSGYYTREPNVSDPTQRVAFGTSGHRGSSVLRIEEELGTSVKFAGTKAFKQ